MDLSWKNAFKISNTLLNQLNYPFSFILLDYAWVTLATNDSYSLGALVLAHSLRKVKTAHKLAALITPSVTKSMREQLQTVFDMVKEVDILDSKDEAHLALLKRPELGITFTKIHCWRLTEFEKCVFLDADTLVVRNCDELFEREEFSAAPDVSWPDCFNSGVFVYRPSIETFNKLLQCAVEKGSFDGGDQGLLNQFFSDWATEDIKKHLPFVYNLTSVATYSYIPAFKQYGSETRIVHFIGTGKPWLQTLDPSTRTITPTPGSEHLASLLQEWWNIFCDKVHPKLDKNLEFANRMSQLRVDACSNCIAVECYDEPETPCLLEPYTQYGEISDCRQYNLPYTPFNVKGSSGELLNIEFFIASVAPKESLDSLEEQQRQVNTSEYVDSNNREETLPNDENRKDDDSEEKPIETDANNNVRIEPEVEKDEDGRIKEEQSKDLFFDCHSLFPDENCINNYLQHNTYTTNQLFDHNLHYNHHHDNSHSCNEDADEYALPRLLEIPHNDIGQSGNNDRMEFERRKQLQASHFHLTSDNIRTEATEEKEEDVKEKRKLKKAKSTSQLVHDVKQSKTIQRNSYLTSKSESLSDVNSDPSKKYSMPKLKPLLPKENSQSKFKPSTIPKVTLYTEILMSSEYKEPVNIPKDSVGFVETHIPKENCNKKEKFGPLPYVYSPEIDNPVVRRRKIPLGCTGNDIEVYELESCKRQMGNKPKPKRNRVQKDGNSSLPALQPLLPAEDKTSTFIRKMKRKESSLSPGNDDSEKRIRRAPRETKESTKRKKEPKPMPPRNVEQTKTNVKEILRRLCNFSRNYQHYFGILTDGADKSTPEENKENRLTGRLPEKEIPDDQMEDEEKSYEVLEKFSNMTDTKSMETQAPKAAELEKVPEKDIADVESRKKEPEERVIEEEEAPNAEFRQFRTYFKDYTQKGLQKNSEDETHEEVKSWPEKAVSDNKSTKVTQTRISISLTEEKKIKDSKDETEADGLAEKDNNGDFTFEKKSKILEERSLLESKAKSKKDKSDSSVVIKKVVESACTKSEVGENIDKSDEKTFSNPSVVIKSAQATESEQFMQKAHRWANPKFRNLVPNEVNSYSNVTESSTTTVLESDHGSYQISGYCGAQSSVTVNHTSIYQVINETHYLNQAICDNENKEKPENESTRKLKKKKGRKRHENLCIPECYTSRSEQESGVVEELITKEPFTRVTQRGNVIKQTHKTYASTVKNSQTSSPESTNNTHRKFKSPKVITTPDQVANSSLGKSKTNSPKSLKKVVVPVGTPDIVVSTNRYEILSNDSPDVTNNTSSEKTKKSAKNIKALLSSSNNTTSSETRPSTASDNCTSEERRNQSGIAGALARLSLQPESESSGSTTEIFAAHQEYLRRQNWETGNMDYMGKDSFDNIWSKICQTVEGKDIEVDKSAKEAIIPTETDKPSTTLAGQAQTEPLTTPGTPLNAKPAPATSTAEVKSAPGTPTAEVKPAPVNPTAASGALTAEAKPASDTFITEIKPASTPATPTADAKPVLVTPTAEVKLAFGTPVAEVKPAPATPTAEVKPAPSTTIAAPATPTAETKEAVLKSPVPPATGKFPVSLSSIIQTPEYIETLLPETTPVSGEDDIIFSKLENRQTQLTNIIEEKGSEFFKEVETVKLSDILGPGTASQLTQDEKEVTAKKVEPKAPENLKTSIEIEKPSVEQQDNKKSVPEQKGDFKILTLVPGTPSTEVISAPGSSTTDAKPTPTTPTTEIKPTPVTPAAEVKPSSYPAPVPDTPPTETKPVVSVPGTEAPRPECIAPATEIKQVPATPAIEDKPLPVTLVPETKPTGPGITIETKIFQPGIHTTETQKAIPGTSEAPKLDSPISTVAINFIPATPVRETKPDLTIYSAEVTKPELPKISEVGEKPQTDAKAAPISLPDVPKDQEKAELTDKETTGAASESIPPPLPEKIGGSKESSPKGGRKDSLKGDGKQKKGVFTKILEVVGIKDKNEEEVSKSVFYDLDTTTPTDTKVIPLIIGEQTPGEAVKKEDEQIPEKKEESVSEKLEEAPKEIKKQGEAPKTEPPKEKIEEEKAKNESKSADKSQITAIPLPTPQGLQPLQEVKNEGEKEEPKGKKLETELKKNEEASQKTDKEEELGKPSLETTLPEKDKPIPKPIRKSSPSAVEKKTDERKEEAKLPSTESAPSVPLPEKKRGKHPSPKLSLSRKPGTVPETTVTTPTPPAAPEASKERRDSSLLKTDEKIPETPPVPQEPKKEAEKPTKGKIKSEIDDIIGKAKSEVESRFHLGEGSATEESDIINTMKLLAGDDAPKSPEPEPSEKESNKGKKDNKKLKCDKLPPPMYKGEEIEELKVTPEEERKKHKGQVTSSKLSDQILKAIPPPRRKAISDSKGEASSPTATIPQPSLEAVPAEEKSIKEDKPEGDAAAASTPATVAASAAAPATANKTPPSSATAKQGRQSSKGSSGPVPPPRNRSKPRQPTPPKGKTKK